MSASEVDSLGPNLGDRERERAVNMISCLVFLIPSYLEQLHDG